MFFSFHGEQQICTHSVFHSPFLLLTTCGSSQLQLLRLPQLHWPCLQFTWRNLSSGIHCRPLKPQKIVVHVCLGFSAFCNSETALYQYTATQRSDWPLALKTGSPAGQRPQFTNNQTPLRQMVRLARRPAARPARPNPPGQIKPANPRSSRPLTYWLQISFPWTAEMCAIWPDYCTAVLSLFCTLRYRVAAVPAAKNPSFPFLCFFFLLRSRTSS